MHQLQMVPSATCHHRQSATAVQGADRRQCAGAGRRLGGEQVLVDPVALRPRHGDGGGIVAPRLQQMPRAPRLPHQQLDKILPGKRHAALSQHGGRGREIVALGVH